MIRELNLIALDIETTGQYPFAAEICELAAVKWSKGQIVDQFQTLIRPNQLMGDFVISIHNITNEMVSTAPAIEEKIAEFHAFIADGICIAHHAPFDLGFITVDLERANQP